MIVNNPRLWEALFADKVPHEQTEKECDFIEYFLPLDSFHRLLDLACGSGRHVIELASRGYELTGVDINVKALQVAASLAVRRGVGASFVAGDLRELDHLDGQFDGIILFWQTFGFFNNTIQVGIFTQLRRLLRPGGRLILDLHNALYYRSQTSFTTGAAEELTAAFDDVAIAPHRPSDTLPYEDDLQVELRRSDLFDPSLFTPGEIAGVAANHGFGLVAACSEYSPDIAATREHQKMQLVFEYGVVPGE